MGSKKRYTDLELLSRIGSGGKEHDAAFTELYSRYSHSIYLYCRRLAGNEADADDVYQETFLRFYKKARQGEQIQTVQAYLLRIARNVFLNMKRDSPQTSMLEDRDIVMKSEDYEKKEMYSMISTALELLDFSYREAFVLRFYQGLSYKEMAATTGDTVSALKVRVMRAKEQIREILSPYISDLSKI